MYMCSWTREFDALVACVVVISSPLANEVRSSSVLKGRKDCGIIARTPLALVIGLEPDASPLVKITCLVVESLGATLASYVGK
jgi:hypothetical protein